MITIENIHTNKRFPDQVYASVFQDGELQMSATLDQCVQRAKELAKKEGN